MLDILSLLNELGIQPGSSKQAAPGWINVTCPFCTGHYGHHLGFNLKGQFFNCWRCGFKPTIKAISALGKINFREAKSLIDKYTILGLLQEKEVSHEKPAEVILPKHSLPMRARHKKYLEKRGLNPDEMEEKYELLGTDMRSDLPWRIIIPVTLNGRIVSWHSRDITGLSTTPHKACPQNREVIPHKSIIYAYDQSRGASVAIVEGVFDAMKLGPGAVATFGITVRRDQVLFLMEKYKKAYIIFDPEKEAQKRAENLCRQLNEVIEAYIVDWEWEADDPAELTRTEAKKLMLELGLR